MCPLRCACCAGGVPRFAAELCVRIRTADPERTAGDLYPELAAEPDAEPPADRRHRDTGCKRGGGRACDPGDPTSGHGVPAAAPHDQQYRPDVSACRGSGVGRADTWLWDSANAGGVVPLRAAADLRERVDGTDDH